MHTRQGAERPYTEMPRHTRGNKTKRGGVTRNTITMYVNGCTSHVLPRRAASERQSGPCPKRRTQAATPQVRGRALDAAEPPTQNTPNCVAPMSSTRSARWRPALGNVGGKATSSPCARRRHIWDELGPRTETRGERPKRWGVLQLRIARGATRWPTDPMFDRPERDVRNTIFGHARVERIPPPELFCGAGSDPGAQAAVSAQLHALDTTRRRYDALLEAAPTAAAMSAAANVASG